MPRVGLVFDQSDEQIPTPALTQFVGGGVDLFALRINAIAEHRARRDRGGALSEPFIKGVLISVLKTRLGEYHGGQAKPGSTDGPKVEALVWGSGIRLVMAGLSI